MSDYVTDCGPHGGAIRPDDVPSSIGLFHDDQGDRKRIGAAHEATRARDRHDKLVVVWRLTQGKEGAPHETDYKAR